MAEEAPTFSFTPKAAAEAPTFDFKPPDPVFDFNANDVPRTQSEVKLNTVPQADLGFEMGTEKTAPTFTFIPKPQLELTGPAFTYTPDPTKDTKDTLLDAVTLGPRSILYGFGDAAAASGHAIGTILDKVGGLLDSTWTGNEIQKAGKAVEDATMWHMQRHQEQTQKDVTGPLTAVISGAGQSFGQMIPALAGGSFVGAMGRGVTAASEVGSALAGVTTAFQSRASAIDQGLDEWSADKYAFRDGLAEVIGERIALPKFLGEAKFASKFWKGMLWELGTEEMTTLAQYTNQVATLQPETTFEDFWKGLGQQEFMTAAIVPLIVAGQSGLIRGIQKSQAVVSQYQRLMEIEKGLGKEPDETTKSIMDGIRQAGEELQAKDDAAAITYHGDNDQQKEDSGKRKVNPDSEEEIARVHGELISSESNGWMGSFTFGSEKDQPVQDAPDPQVEAEAAQTQQTTNLNKFLNQTPKQKWHEQVKRLVADQVSSWKADLNVTVIENWRQLPDELHAWAKKNDPENIRGLFDGGNNIYVMSDKITSPEELRTTVIHESTGHWGMEQIIPSWDKMAPLILDFAPKGMTETWNDVNSRYKINKIPFNDIAREVLAVHTERNPTATNKFLDTVKAEYRQFLRDKFNVFIPVNNADVINLLRKARRAVEQGTREKKPGMGPAKSNRIYRSEWDPAVRNWGESWFGTSNFPIFEDMSPNTFNLYSDEHQALLETGKPVMIRSYHATPFGDREAFDPSKLGSNTSAEDATRAHFFATEPSNTHYYATFQSDNPAGTLIGSLHYDQFDTVAASLVENSPYDVVYNQESGNYYTVNTNTNEVVAVSDKRWIAVNDVKEAALKDFSQLPYKEQVAYVESVVGKGKMHIDAPTSFPVYIAAVNPLVVEDTGDYSLSEEEDGWAWKLIEASRAGHDVVIFKNAIDPEPDNVVAVLKGHENQIRSVNAKFDLTQKHSPNLLASRGKLHRVRLDKNFYLDLEKPLGEQTQQVKDAIEAMGLKPSLAMTGQQFYDALVTKHGGAKEASAVLDQAGIHGATWQEGFKGELIRNYSTFSKTNAEAVTVEMMKQLAEEKSKAQGLLSTQVQERAKEAPAVTYSRRVELFSKALKMTKQMEAMQKDDATQWNLFIKYFYGIEELAYANPHIVQLQTYLKASRDWWSTKGKWTTEANSRVRKWRKMVSATQIEQFDTLLYEADIASQKLGRALTMDEVKALIEERQLSRLGDEQIALAHEIWEDYRKAFKAVGEALEYDIKRTIGDEFAQRAAINEMWKAIKTAQDRNYLPKSNFGEWTIEFTARKDMTYQGRDFQENETVHFSTHATEEDQGTAFQELRKRFPERDFKETRSVITNARTMEFMGVPDSFVNALLDRADLDSDARAEVEATLSKLQHEQSATSRLMRQVMKNTRAFGYDENTMRVYASFMQRFSNQIAKLEHGPNMQRAIDSMANETQGDFTKKQQILAWLREHRKYMSDPGNELTAWRSFGFNFFIGGVVKSALVNGFQVPMVSFPYLSQKYNEFAAIRALTKNIDAYFQQYDKFKPRQYSPEKLDMFNRLAAVLNESFANELAAVAEGSTLEDLLNKRSDVLRGADRVNRAIADKFAFLFHHAELWNRYITAGAMYDLAIEKGDSHPEAVLKAAEAVRWTQGEYARYNRPLIMRGKKSAAFLFMRYMAHMLSIYLGNSRESWRVLAMLILASGLLGLPFAENVLDLFDIMATEFKRKTGWHDPQVQSRLELKRYIAGLRPDPNNPLNDFVPSADSIMHGFSRKLPLPFSKESYDVSTSLSMGRIVPGTEELSKMSAGQAEVGNLLLQAGGALASIPLGVWNAMSSDNPDTWKVSEQVLPLAVRNVSAAYRWYQRGYEENSKGQKLMEFDPATDMSTIIYKGLGFTPTRLNETREKEWMQKSRDAFYANWHNDVMKSYTNALIERNDANIEAARKSWERFNAQAPPEFAITPESMMQSARLRAQGDALHEMGFPVNKKNIQAYRDIDEIVEKAR